MNKNHSAVQLPDAFLPMLAGHPGGFIARMEGKGNAARIILEPVQAKVGAIVPPKSPAKGNGGKGRTAEVVSSPTTAIRPAFRYTLKDRRLSTEQAERYGLSATRLKVLKAIAKAKNGLLARQIMTQCKLPHGSVQQTLNWLRTHELVEGRPITL